MFIRLLRQHNENSYFCDKSNNHKYYFQTNNDVLYQIVFFIMIYLLKLKYFKD